MADKHTDDVVEKTHETECPTKITDEKWQIAGQIAGETPTQLNIVTSLFCKVCGHIKINISSIKKEAGPITNFPKGLQPRPN